LFGRRKSTADSTVTQNPATGGSLLGSTTIAWNDADKENNVMWKVPRLIRLNDNIVVREDETAVFYRDGKVLTYFDQPNRYALTDFNAPVVGKLLKSFTGVQQQAEVFYIKKIYMDGKYGSTQPYQFTDPTFGIVNLRIFGEYRWKISDPENFINQFVGTLNMETSDQVEARLREQLVILVYNAIGKMKSQGMKVTDLATSLTNIEQIVLSLAPPAFGQYGIEINKISGLTISLPDEVQKAIDTRSEMGVLGVNYMQYQVGQAVVDAAKNPSGTAGVGAGLGVGLGAGIGVGGALGGAMAQGMYGQPTKNCISCGSLIPMNNAFCPNCGASQAQGGGQSAQMQQQQQQQTGTRGGTFCAQCGNAVPSGVKFCPNCGAAVAQASSQARTCPNCGTAITAPTKFCPNCGTKL
jgi:membrane protease subunit (stomatin/prohibitin family)